MTGLQVVEVNISVDDIHLPTDDTESKSDTKDESQPSRVQ